MKSYRGKWKSDWGWCLGGAYFLAKFQAGGAYSGGAYKKSVHPKDLKKLINRKYFASATRLHVYQDTGPTSGIYCYALRKAQ